MFRLFRGEIMKIVRMPTIYILTIVLALVITFSFLLYNPTSNTCQTYPSNVNFDASIETIYKNYYDNSTDKFSKTHVNNFLVANPNKNSVEDMLNYYDANIAKYNEEGNQTQKSAREKTIKSLNELADIYIKLLKEYSHISTIPGGVNLSRLDEIANELYAKLFDIKNQIEIDCKKTTNSAPTTAYLITQESFSNITKTLENNMKEISNKVPIDGVSDSAKDSTKSAYDNLDKAIKSYFSNASLINISNEDFQLTAKFKEVTEELNLSTSFLDSIKEQYLTNAKIKLAENTNDLEQFYAGLDLVNDNNFETKEELLNKISLQFSTGYYANLLAQSKVVMELSKEYTDEKFNTFIGISDLMTNYKETYQMDRFNQYNFRQNLSHYQAIYDNNLIEYNYGTAFSSSSTSNFTRCDGTSAINAFDYSFYVLDIFSFVIIIFVVILASNMIAGEQKDNTMKLLAIRPYTRNQILGSKILVTLFFSLIFVLMSIAISLIAGYFMYGINFNDLIITINATATFAMSPFLLYLIYIGCLFVKILFYVLFAFLISTLLRSYMAATIINIFCILIATVGNYLLGTITLWKFLPFSNLDIFKYFGNGTFSESSSIFTSNYIIPGTDLVFSLIVSFAFIILFAIMTHLVFKKRDII